MEFWLGADRAGVQVAGHEIGQETHRVIDPADPPRDLSGWAWGAYVSLGLMVILSLVQLSTAVGLHSAVTDGGDVVGSYRDYDRWSSIHGLLVLITAGVFITWFFQAYKNLRRLGLQNMRYGNGWAVGSWFVPILGLWRPKQIANDIWRGSERGTDASSGWRAVAVPGLVHWWWGLFLVQGFAVYAGQQATESGYRDLSTLGQLSSGISQIKTGTTVDAIGEVLAIVAAILAIVFVARVTERLDEVGGDAFAQVAQAPQYAPAQYAQYPPAPPVPAYPPPAPQHQSHPPPPPPPPPTEQRIQCPECAEWIQAQANVCRYCGHRLRPFGQ